MVRIMKKFLIFGLLVFSLSGMAKKESYYMANCWEYGKPNRVRVYYTPQTRCLDVVTNRFRPCIVFAFNGLAYWNENTFRKITLPDHPLYRGKEAVSWEMIMPDHSSYIISSHPNPYEGGGEWRGFLYRKIDYAKPEMEQLADLICVKPERKNLPWRFQ